MPALFLYMIKLSCSLGILWLFYRLVLHDLTFYTLNRWYLLGYTILSFMIPFIDISNMVREEQPSLQPIFIRYIPTLGTPRIPFVQANPWWTPWQLALLILLLGSLFLLLRFVTRWLSLKSMRRRAILLDQNPVKIFRVREAVTPFSFGNAIYINPDRHTAKEWEEIILHEYVHIRQHHTVDILLAEWLTILNWYNPFAWLIRYSIRQNLEFIADQTVVAHGFDRKSYQYHLLKVLGQDSYRLGNNFNFSSLKKRIIMMNKMKSARLHLLRFLFILPLIAVLLVAFRDRLPLKPVSKPGHLESVNKSVQSTITHKPDRSKARIPKPAVPRDTIPVPASPDTAFEKEKALVIVDGVEIPHSALDTMNPAKFATIDIIKGDQATELFGEKGAHGVIAIITKSGQQKLTIPPSFDPERAKPNNDPLFIVDGQIAPNGILDSLLKPDDIASINVSKNEQGKAIYGERARNGVVYIHLKPSVRVQDVLDGKRRSPIRIPADSLKKDTIIHLRG